MELETAWVDLVWELMGYYPNEHQRPIIDALLSGTRFILLCGGERSGKSMTTVAAALMFMGPRDGEEGEKRLYWIVGPDYAQARAEFSYMYDALNKAGLVESASMPENPTSPWSMKLPWGVAVRTRTSSDVTKLASFPPDGILMVEAAQQSHEVWLKCRGRVAEKRGWVIMSGTLEEGLPWYANTLRKWKGPNAEGGMSFSLATWTNTAIFPGGREDPEIKMLEASMPTDLFMERFAAEPAMVSRLVVKSFDYTIHVKDLDVVEDVPFSLAIDPGQHTYAVLFLQKLGQFAYVHDAVYVHGLTVQEVVPLCVKSPFWPLLGEEGHVIDIAGRQHHANKSQVEIWRELTGLNLSTSKAPIPLQDTINTINFRLQSNNTFGQPLVYFSSRLPNPEPGPDGRALHFLSEFNLWRWRKVGYNQNEARKPIDKNNDGIKALGYWLVYHYGVHETRRNRVKIRRRRYWKQLA